MIKLLNKKIKYKNKKKKKNYKMYVITIKFTNFRFLQY